MARVLNGDARHHFEACPTYRGSQFPKVKWPMMESHTDHVHVGIPRGFNLVHAEKSIVARGGIERKS